MVELPSTAPPSSIVGVTEERSNGVSSETLYLRVLTGDIQRQDERQFRVEDLRLTVPEVPALVRPNGADPSTTDDDVMAMAAG